MTSSLRPASTAAVTSRRPEVERERRLDVAEGQTQSQKVVYGSSALAHLLAYDAATAAAAADADDAKWMRLQIRDVVS